MDEILNIYDARLTFRKTKSEEKVVSVVIRYSKRRNTRKREFSAEEIRKILRESMGREDVDIEDEELCWRLYHKEHIAIYHRINKDKYMDLNHYEIAQTSLSQKLERLVHQVHNGLAGIFTEPEG